MNLFLTDVTYIISYRIKGPWRAGVLRNSLLLDADKLMSGSTGQGINVRNLIEAGETVVNDMLRRAYISFEKGNDDFIPLDKIEIGPPIPDPRKIICLGLNYYDHARELQMTTPEKPTFFAKFSNALRGPADSIVIPKVSMEIDYEGELVVVIGRRCKDMSDSDALACVAGYTIMNDVSARDLQFETSQWTAGKSLDTFAPLGPGIVPACEITDPQTLPITTKVNGTTLQIGNTEEMIFSISSTIAFLSSLMTLEPGDIISTGTPAGVGFKRQPPIYLRAGDIVEIEIGRIGKIRNPVVSQEKA